MGCGKSTTGKLLAKKMHMDFVDLDVQIEKEQNTSVAKLFSEKGEEYFRKIEQKALSDVCKKTNTVIAVGGGAPCFFNNIHTINANSVSVYLKQSVDTLFERLKNERASRPLINSLNDSQLKTFISELLEKRDPFYQLAHYKVKAKDLLIGALSDFIKEQTLTEKLEKS